MIERIKLIGIIISSNVSILMLKLQLCWNNFRSKWYERKLEKCEIDLYRQYEKWGL